MFLQKKNCKSGLIGIHNHRIICLIGCNPTEKVVEQEIFVTVELRADFSICVDSDEVADTINYVEIAALCTRLAQGNRYSLLETLAYNILKEIFTVWNIDWARVAVRKPGAIPGSDYAWVEMERSRE